MNTTPKVRLTAGRLVYLALYQPLGWLHRSWREGGPANQLITANGRRAMMHAATLLPPLAQSPADAPEISFLTGKRFWYQTAFCFWSLCRQAGRPLRATFFDDGTFDKSLRAESARVFPGSRVCGAEEVHSLLDQYLPNQRYPALRKRRLAYPNLRKLTDCHAGGQNWRLVLDSDMLFFHRPAALMDWLQSPSQPLHMTDVQNAYGYSPALMEKLTGQKIPQLVNVGICGLQSAQIDWDQLEHWCQQLEAAEGTSYYLEQALVAMLLAGQTAERLPTRDYRLLPNDEECCRPTAALHHYVDLSKRGYFRYAWRVA